MYILLDGHLRLEVLKELGVTSARCLVSTDDEAYTYNKRISKLATIQEHMMVLNAITKGHLSEDRIAKALNLDIASIRKKRDLLIGIGAEAVEVLKNRTVSVRIFAFLRKMKPLRQLAVAELLVATNNFSVAYIKALLAATPAEMLVDPDKRKVIEGLTPEQIAKMEKEMDSLNRDLKLIEASHGNEVLNLVLARGYLAKLFGNARVVRYLAQNYDDIFRELQSIVEATSLES
jgi:ParB-like chromosome segregation protein Spo0J